MGLFNNGLYSHAGASYVRAATMYAFYPHDVRMFCAHARSRRLAEVLNLGMETLNLLEQPVLFPYTYCASGGPAILSRMPISPPISFVHGNTDELSLPVKQCTYRTPPVRKVLKRTSPKSLPEHVPGRSWDAHLLPIRQIRRR